jgi:hypothetical protein
MAHRHGLRRGNVSFIVPLQTGLDRTVRPPSGGNVKFGVTVQARTRSRLRRGNVSLGSPESSILLSFIGRQVLSIVRVPLDRSCVVLDAFKPILKSNQNPASPVGMKVWVFVFQSINHTFPADRRRDGRPQGRTDRQESKPSRPRRQHSCSLAF